MPFLVFPGSPRNAPLRSSALPNGEYPSLATRLARPDLSDGAGSHLRSRSRWLLGNGNRTPVKFAAKNDEEIRVKFWPRESLGY